MRPCPQSPRATRPQTDATRCGRRSAGDPQSSRGVSRDRSGTISAALIGTYRPAAGVNAYAQRRDRSPASPHPIQPRRRRRPPLPRSGRPITRAVVSPPSARHSASHPPCTSAQLPPSAHSPRHRPYCIDLRPSPPISSRTHEPVRAADVEWHPNHKVVSPRPRAERQRPIHPPLTPSRLIPALSLFDACPLTPACVSALATGLKRWVQQLPPPQSAALPRRRIGMSDDTTAQSHQRRH